MVQNRGRFARADLCSIYSKKGGAAHPKTKLAIAPSDLILDYSTERAMAEGSGVRRRGKVSGTWTYM